jgi:hypothetical protein
VPRNDLWLSRSAFEKLVAEAIDGLPLQFAELLENVAVVVEEEPEPRVLAEMGMDEDEELLGLYVGVRSPNAIRSTRRCPTASPSTAARCRAAATAGGRGCARCARRSFTSSGTTSGSKTRRCLSDASGAVSDPVREHEAYAPQQLGWAVLTVSSSRTLGDDRSSDRIAAMLAAAGHQRIERRVVSDNAAAITVALHELLGCAHVDVIVVTGGTGV